MSSTDTPSATARLVEKAAGAPKQLGEYRILREIGRGGMGIVYEPCSNRSAGTWRFSRGNASSAAQRTRQGLDQSRPWRASWPADSYTRRVTSVPRATRGTGCRPVNPPSRRSARRGPRPTREVAAPGQFALSCQFGRNASRAWRSRALASGDDPGPRAGRRPEPGLVLVVLSPFPLDLLPALIIAA